MNLQEFLNNNVVEGITKKVTVGERFVDENGKALEFEIKAFTQKELSEMRKKATSVDKKGNNSYNAGLLSSLCVIENTVNPNFKDMESIKKLNCSTAEQYLNKVMLAGEIEILAGEIFGLSGFGKTFNELIEEAKN